MPERSSTGLATLLDDGSRTYVYGLGLAYAVTGTGIEVYHTDRLGSVRALTDASGAITATYATDAWGVPTAGTGSSDQPFGFTGEPRDPTGLTYLRSRYYDPELGRFTSRDTWPGVPAVPQTQDPYAYVGNNPLTRTDPSGHHVDTILDIGFIVYDAGALLFGPPKERQENLGALFLDVGSAFVPFVAGAGFVARAARTELKLSATVAGHGAARPFVHSSSLVEWIMTREYLTRKACPMLSAGTSQAS